MFGTGPIDKLALNGNVSGRDLQISGKNVAQPISVKELNLALTPTDHSVQRISGDNGQDNRVGSRRPSPVHVQEPGQSTRLCALPAQRSRKSRTIARAYGITGLDQLSGAGALSFDLALQDRWNLSLLQMCASVERKR